MNELSNPLKAKEVEVWTHDSMNLLRSHYSGIIIKRIVLSYWRIADDQISAQNFTTYKWANVLCNELMGEAVSLLTFSLWVGGTFWSPLNEYTIFISMLCGLKIGFQRMTLFKYGFNYCNILSWLCLMKFWFHFWRKTNYGLGDLATSEYCSFTSCGM